LEDQVEIDSYAHGEPSWHDQSSPDAEKAAEFYGALFGWEIPEGDPEFGGYRNASLNGKTVAGITPQMNPGPSFWSTYVNVDNADDAAALVTDNGGQVVFPPMTVGEFGRMGFFMDPTGAALGIWEPGTHKGAQVRNVPGAVCWYELVTSDVAAATTFYEAVFGWVAQAHGPATGPGGYTEFKVGDKMVGGMMAKTPMMPAEMPSNWAVYFAVDDADAAAAKVTELGGQVMMGPMDIEPGRFAVVADPTGAVFNILKSSR
jgi:uncharacterized protein